MASPSVAVVPLAKIHTKCDLSKLLGETTSQAVNGTHTANTLTHTSLNSARFSSVSQRLRHGLVDVAVVGTYAVPV